MGNAVSLLLVPIIPLALGRGLNNGADSANAMTTVLIDSDEIKLQLSLYNELSEQDKSVLELHGDLDLELKGAAALYQEFGWCLGPDDGDQTKWDCMRVRTLADPTKMGEGQYS